MRKLMITTAAALLAGTALAAAQGMPSPSNKSEGAAPAPAVQQKAPAEKMGQAQAPAGASQMKPAEPKGQAQKADDKAPAKAADTKPMDNKADAQKSAADNKADAQKSATDSKADANKAAADKSKPDATKAASDTKPADKTTGQGAAATRSNVNVTTEQKTTIRTVIRDKVKAQPVTNVNFSVNIGTRVPREVRYYPVPTEIVSINPGWSGYYFILVNDQIVIIEPSTFEIVYIIV